MYTSKEQQTTTKKAKYYVQVKKYQSPLLSLRQNAQTPG